MINRRRAVGLGILAATVCWTFAATLRATPPTLGDMQPRGLQIGGTTEIAITGSDFDDSVRLICPVSPSMRVCPVSVERGQARFQVTLDSDAAPGIYPIRLATERGLSGAISIGIDQLPQQPFSESIVSLPVALHGRIEGNRVLATTFEGKAGDRLVVDIEARRLGSSLRPVLRLFSPANRLIDVAQPSQRIGGDARMDVSLPDDGLYRLELQDIVFDAGGANWFRLKIGQLEYADVAFPLAVSRPVGTEVSLIRTGTPIVGKLNPRAWRVLDIPVQPESNAPAAPFTGALPRVHLSPPGTQEWTEDEARAAPDRLVAPLGINGRLAAPGENDEFEVRVSPGEKLCLQVDADRWGSPLDAVLAVISPDGQSLAESDDQPGSTDPRVDVEVPPDVDRLRVRVSSRIKQGGESFVYRLAVGPSVRRPAVLEVESQSLNLPSGDVVVMPVAMDRGESPCPLRLALPEALEHVVTVYPERLESTDEVGLISFTAAPNTRGVFRGWLQAICDDGPQASSAWLRCAQFPGSQYQPRWREDLMIAVTPPGPLRIAWTDEGNGELVQGATLPLEIEVERRAGASGSVRLTLLTSQRPPEKQVNGQSQPDEARALRLAAEVTVAADADRAKLELVIPADLALQAWSFAIKGELLGDDGRQVLATAYTPLRRWMARSQ